MLTLRAGDRGNFLVHFIIHALHLQGLTTSVAETDLEVDLGSLLNTWRAFKCCHISLSYRRLILLGHAVFPGFKHTDMSDCPSPTSHMRVSRMASSNCICILLFFVPLAILASLVNMTPCLYAPVNWAPCLCFLHGTGKSATLLPSCPMSNNSSFLAQESTLEETGKLRLTGIVAVLVRLCAAARRLDLLGAGSTFIAAEVTQWLIFAQETVIRAEKKRLMDLVRQVNAHLANRTYLAGHGFTVADALTWAATRHYLVSTFQSHLLSIPRRRNQPSF